MSNYTQSTFFTPKDSLTTNDPLKIIRGVDFDTEFSAISTAIASKADSNDPGIISAVGIGLDFSGNVITLDFSEVPTGPLINSADFLVGVDTSTASANAAFAVSDLLDMVDTSVSVGVGLDGDGSSGSPVTLDFSELPEESGALTDDVAYVVRGSSGDSRIKLKDERFRSRDISLTGGQNYTILSEDMARVLFVANSGGSENTVTLNAAIGQDDQKFTVINDGISDIQVIGAVTLNGQDMSGGPHLTFPKIAARTGATFYRKDSTTWFADNIVFV